MRQLKLPLLLLLLSAMMTSCDSSYHGRVHIQNFSSKSVTFRFKQTNDDFETSIEIPANNNVVATEFQTKGNMSDAPDIQTFLTEMSLAPTDTSLHNTKDINLSVNWYKMYRKIRGRSGEEWNYIYYISDGDIK